MNLKKICLILAGVMLFSFAISGCKPNSDPDASGETSFSSGGKDVNLNIGEKDIYLLQITSATKGDYKTICALKAVQGIVNREKPLLYIECTDASAYPYKFTDTQWVEVLKNDGYNFIKINTITDVYTIFKDFFNGLIIIDSVMKNDGGYTAADSDFACMVAGLTDYAPVTQPLSNKIARDTGLSVLEEVKIGDDFTIDSDISRGLQKLDCDEPVEVYRLAFEKFLKTGMMNQTKVMAMVNESMDYAVKEKMLYYTLYPDHEDSRQKQLYDEILDYMESQEKAWNMYGWVQEESSGLKYTSDKGGVIDCVADGNLSLMSALPGPETLTQKAGIKKQYDPSKIYLTFMASENDTIKAIQSFQHGAWLDPNRGKVPISWGAIADAIDEFPYILNYYYNSATENDYFFSGGGSACGFVDPDEDMPANALKDLCQKNKTYLERTDQKFIDFYTDQYNANDKFTPTQVAEYLKNSGINNFISRVNTISPELGGLWGDVFFFNRYKNMYPRREVNSDITIDDFDRISSTRWTYTPSNNYYHLSVYHNNVDGELSVKLFTQSNGDGYHYYVKDSIGYLSKTVNGTETVLASVPVSVSPSSNRLIAIADRSAEIDSASTLKMYYNNKLIGEMTDNSFKAGGIEISGSENSLNSITEIETITVSQEMQIVNWILNDNAKFNVAFYGYIFDRDYSKNQMMVEPGAYTPTNEVMTISPTSIVKIVEILEKKRPGVYEVVNLAEFMDFARKYYTEHNSLE